MAKRIFLFLLTVTVYFSGASSTTVVESRTSDCHCLYYFPGLPPEFSFCIPETTICDGNVDCENGTDEINCESHECSQKFFKCDGICKFRVRCNGTVDCEDGTDELDCENYDCEGDRKCKTSPLCIDPKYVCNGKQDCPDGSDEGCYECDDYEIKCGNLESECVNIQQFCDGIADCENGEDEKNCQETCTVNSTAQNPLDPNPQCSNSSTGGICNFGFDGQFCNETCTRCRWPFCETTAFNDKTFYRLIDFAAGTPPCIPEGAQTIEIIDTNLATLRSELFAGIAKNLTNLRLNNISYDCMDRHFLTDMSSSLKLLYLNRMGFTENSLPVLKNLRKLLVLNLDFNNISILDDNFLEGTNDVIKVSMAHNNLKRLQGGLFSKLGSLFELHLAFNSLANDIDLTGYFELRMIDLSHNCIEYLPKLFFEDLRDLKRIIFRGNPITTLPSTKGVAIGSKQHIIIIIPEGLNCSSFDDNVVEQEIRCTLSESNSTRQLQITDEKNDCENDTCAPDTCIDLIGGFVCGNEGCGMNDCYVRKDPKCASQNENFANDFEICDIPCECPKNDEPTRCSDMTLTKALIDVLCLPKISQKLELTNVDSNETTGSNYYISLMRMFYQITSLSLREMRVDFLQSVDVTIVQNTQELVLDAVNLNGVPNYLSMFTNLTNLAITRNNLSVIINDDFKALTELIYLNLTNNRIGIVFPGAFNGLNKLIKLDLSHNKIVEFHPNIFAPLSNLEVVNVSDNLVSRYPSDIFSGMTKLNTIHGDVFTICCLVDRLNWQEITCTPDDDISSCERLIANDILRVFIWIQAFFTAFGNTAVIILRLREYRDVGRSVHQKTAKINIFLIGMLGLADFIMCVYLFIVASVDQIYAGDYYLHSHKWLQSSTCSAAGVLAIFSSETSVLMLSLITVTRLLSVVQPLNYLTVDVRIFYFSATIIWLMALVLAIAPFMGFESLSNYFSASSATCLPSFYSSTSESSWGYTLSIIIINLLCFITMLVAYVILIYVAKKNRESSKHLKMSAIANRKTDSKGRKLNVRVAILVITDMLCWIPICIISLYSISQNGLKSDFHKLIYPITAIVLMPINSTFNPIIYTLLTSKSLSKKFKDALGRLWTETESDSTGHSSHSRPQSPTNPLSSPIAKPQGNPNTKSRKSSKNGDKNIAVIASGTLSTELYSSVDDAEGEFEIVQ